MPDTDRHALRLWGRTGFGAQVSVAARPVRSSRSPMPSRLRVSVPGQGLCSAEYSVRCFLLRGHEQLPRG